MEKEKGVCWDMRRQKWEVRIGQNNIRHFLGLYTTLDEANNIAKNFRESHNKSRNKFVFKDNVIEIYITKRDGTELVSFVDSDAYTIIKNYTWCVTQGGRGKRKYYVTRGRDSGGNALLHRVVIDAPTGFEVDHINGNTLDNRKSNLRIVTRQQNSENLQGANSNNKHGYHRGVSWSVKDQKWRARANKGKEFNLGLYKSEAEAAEAAKQWRRENMPFSEMDKEAA